MLRQFAFSSLLCLAITPAFAQDFVVNGGAALEFNVEPDGAGSNNTGAVSGYVEAQKGGFYGGIWAQKWNDSDSDEIDLYLGYRGATEGGLDYDLAYTRYFYPNDGGDCCGDLSAVLGYSLGDTLYPSTEIHYDPETGVGSANLGLDYNVDDKWTLGGTYGVYETDGAPSDRQWDFGVSYALGEESAVDVRYYDGSDFDGYLGLELTWDTTIFGG